jgi:GntR family transcriptional repressor for pyruvate dehydrogenase complex
VSRHKLREELRGLTAMGILEATPRRGTTVRAYDADLWANNLAFHGKVNGYELAEAQEARIAMELSVIPLVIRNATSTDWLRFESLLSKMELSLEDKELKQFCQADQEFHELLVEATHNPLLQMLRPMIRWMFTEVLRSSIRNQQGCTKSFEEHRTVVAALRRRNISQAQQALENHLRNGLKSIKAIASKRDSLKKIERQAKTLKGK